MRSMFAEWYTSTFIKRRWTVLTPASTFIAPAIQWLVNHLSVFPADLRTASVWQAPGWLYALCFVVCFAGVQVLAWVEQHRKVRELSGRPTIVMQFRDDNLAPLLRVTGNFPAIDISGSRIVIAVPIDIAKNVTGTRVDNQVTAGWSPSESMISFSSIASLIEGDIGSFRYRVFGVGQDITSLRLLFESISPNRDLEFPFVLYFSNQGPPKRTWHAHYMVRYSPFTGNVQTNHVDTEEANTQGFCTYCKSVKPRLTLLQWLRRASPTSQSPIRLP